MPLGTLDRTPPPFFRQGPSALSKLTIFSALALFLMVADMRFQVAKPLRVALATALYPVQWAVQQPLVWFQGGGKYVESLRTAQLAADDAQKRLGAMAQRASQSDQLMLENARLRGLLALRERVTGPGQAAIVLYDAADPYTRKVIIDKGLVNGIAPGSPVLDESGVLGQVTRVYPAVSEVTLLIDRDQAIPVLNVRTGVRGVAFGDAAAHSGTLELRFMSANADVQVGDLLTTSGVDGVYPSGLPVARVEKVERRLESAFVRIYCTPVALVDGASFVMVLNPIAAEAVVARPAPEVVSLPIKKGKSK